MNRARGERLELAGIFIIFILILTLTGCTYTVYKGPVHPHIPVVQPSDHK